MSEKLLWIYVKGNNEISLRMLKAKEEYGNAMVIGVLAAVASIAAGILLYDKSIAWMDKSGTDTMTWGTGKLDGVLKK